MSRLSLIALVLAGTVAAVLALGASGVLTAPDSALPWSTSGAGGGSSSSTSYDLGATAGQSPIGASQSANYALGAGYWPEAALDTDNDNVTNLNDACPDDAVNDGDGDGFCAGNGFQPPKTGDNDNCPSTFNPGQENADGDQWGDACDNCPTTSTVWFVPAGDGDCDAFTDTEEGFVGTDAADNCPDNPDDDAWPADMVGAGGYGTHDKVVNILDIVQLTPPVFNSSPPDPNYLPRKDFNGDSAINILDIVRLTPPVFNQSCT